MITNINSKDNEKLKYTRALLKSKNRNKESKFIIEGY
ncbi:RNA methyltransferase, partial [Clostridioides difficile]